MVKLPKWKAGHVGITEISCVNSGKTKELMFITCRKCDTPLRIEFKREESYMKSKDDTWMSIEPMLYVNPCFWFCTDCQKVPIQPPKVGETGFRSDALINRIVDKSKARGEDFTF